MSYRIYIDHFSEEQDGMKRADQRGLVKVLRVLASHKRFSMFKANVNSTIATTLGGLGATATSRPLSAAWIKWADDRG